MDEEVVVESSPLVVESGLPCVFCRHQEDCELWEDGREVCLSFSCQH